jgi:hypothetical protein
VDVIGTGKQMTQTSLNEEMLLKNVSGIVLASGFTPELD